MTEIKVKVCYQVIGKKNEQFCIEPCCSVGTCYSFGKIFIPDDFQVFLNTCDEPIIEIAGKPYMLKDVVINKGGKPYLWNGKTDYAAIPLKFEIEEDTHFS